MKFQVTLPDDAFWSLATTAAQYDLRVPDFLAELGRQLSAVESDNDPLTELAQELRAARAAGYRAPRASVATTKARRLVFTNNQMDVALAAMARTHPRRTAQ